MDKIRKKERKNWFYSYNVIFDLDIPYYAKIVYLYLCRCADEESQAFPSYSTIATKCSISRRSAIRAVKILQEIGLLEKQNRIIESNGKIINTSNIYYIYDAPQTLNQEQKVVTDSHQGWCQCDTRVVTDSHQGGDTLALKGLPIEGLPIEGLPLLHPEEQKNENMQTVLENKNVVVVDELPKPSPEEIAEIKKIAEEELKIPISRQNVMELWQKSKGDKIQVKNGIMAAAQYAAVNEVVDMWSLVSRSVSEGRIPTTIRTTKNKESKKDKYRDLYLNLFPENEKKKKEDKYKDLYMS